MIKYLKNKSVISVLFIATTMTSVIASTTTSDAAYSVSVLKDCKEVGKMTMTSKQISSYLSLKEAELTMKNLEMPIEKIESEMEQYSDEIEVLSELAFQYKDDTFHINKKHINQQKEAVAKLNQLISTHLKDFDALGQQGHKIGKLAREFSYAISDNFKNVDFNNIRVSAPDSDPKEHHCQSKNNI